MDALPVLQIQDLHIDFTAQRKEVPVLRGLSYTLPAGRVLAVVGESGTG